MKSWLFKGMLAAAIALPALSGVARAQLTNMPGCTNLILRGEYRFTVHGETLGIVTSAGPQIFSSPIRLDGVAMTLFNGFGFFTQADFALQGGAQLPGDTDPMTGFNRMKSGAHTVYPDCTGGFTLNEPGLVVEVKFVLANQGNDSHTVVYSNRIAMGIPVGGVTCDISPNCEVIVQVRSDGTKPGP
jgi:hypothetical protein